VKAVMAMRNLSLGRKSINCQVVEVLQLGVSVWNPRLCRCSGHVSFSR